MTERNPSLWLQNRTDHTAENDRALLTTTFSGEEGVANTTDLKVVQHAGTPGMSVDVPAGRAVVQGDDNVNQGMYHVWNDATVTLTIAAANATNPRIDLVVFRVKDAFYSGATNACDLEVVTGTPAASPAAPALPNNAVLLAQIAVAANATSILNANITDKRHVLGRRALRLRRVSASASIGSGTSAAIAWDTEDEDTENTNTPGTTVTLAPGLWVVTFVPATSAGLTTGGSVFIIWNGLTWQTPISAGNGGSALTLVIDATVSPTLTANIFNASGPSVTATAILTAVRLTN